MRRRPAPLLQVQRMLQAQASPCWPCEEATACRVSWCTPPKPAALYTTRSFGEQRKSTHMSPVAAYDDEQEWRLEIWLRGVCTQFGLEPHAVGTHRPSLLVSCTVSPVPHHVCGDWLPNRQHHSVSQVCMPMPWAAAKAVVLGLPAMQQDTGCCSWCRINVPVGMLVPLLAQI